ncbi:hypothetical protein [Streptomyces sp. NPDC005303]|uniref:hypothetical protein n=1 Tax=Streptomyces sp. NPDC005303 TaxID=3155713 RepID=UPI0033A63DDC
MPGVRCRTQGERFRGVHPGRLLYAEGKLFATGPWADGPGALLVFAVERAELEGILEDDQQ